ncbi:hypothetical protein OIU78_020584 [Salix suchowensis]|nr:hypothetical protein OIU78_020584 [Salix suchowensis]
MGEGREGDWECSGCQNRNYAFRSFCNRCKQPRLLVDNKTPPDSKWLPRIGDWICTGCTNNNYASREKCKKCGQPKEVAAMPAIAMPGVSLPTYSHYYARSPGGPDQRLKIGFEGNGALQQPDGEMVTGYAIVASTITLPVHSAKSAMLLLPPVGTKRLASQEFFQDWESKRLNSGNTDGQPQPYPSFNQMAVTIGDQSSGVHVSYPTYSTELAPNWQAPVQIPLQLTTPALLGKGAKQWRNGDWMCANCNNHNYASRAQCNSFAFSTLRETGILVFSLSQSTFIPISID